MTAKPYTKVFTKVTGQTLRKLALPADTHHLFCDKCLAMYRGNSYLDNNILLMVHPDSRGAAMEGMMPLLKAMAAFLDHFTGTQTTFTISKGATNPSGFYRQPRVTDFLPSGTFRPPFDFVKLSIQNLPFNKTNEMASSIANSYAMTQAPNVIMFKSGILLGSSPEVSGMTTAHALAFMVHEFTAHRFDNDFTYWLNDTKTTPTLGEDKVSRAGHFTGPGDHCGIGNKCLNGFTSIGAANTRHALPFFQKWYDDHKDDPLTMYGSPAPSPAPRRRLGSPAPSPAPAPSGSIDVELMAVEMMPIDNKEIISNPGGPLTDFTAFGDFYDVIRNAPSYEGGVNIPSSKMTGDPRGQLINAKYATKHFNAYVEKAKEIYGISGDADWANNDENKEPVYVATYQLKRGHTLYGIGDLHSGIHSLTSILSEIGVTDDWKLPDKTKVVFCGDYLDRGPYSIECLYAVTKLHINNPNRVVLIEGNHEDHQIFERYGAKDEIVSQYAEDFDAAYEATLRTLRSMPTAAFVEIEGSSKAIQFCHGGMVNEDDPTYSKIKEARDTKRLTKISSNDLVHRLKWADFGDTKSKPATLSENRPKFSVDSVAEYCNDLNLHGIISGHQDRYTFQIQAHRVQNYPPHFTDEVNQIVDKIRASGNRANHISGESGLVIDILPNKPQVIKLGKDTQSIIASAATPTRDDIQYPSFIRIRT